MLCVHVCVCALMCAHGTYGALMCVHGADVAQRSGSHGLAPDASLFNAALRCCQDDAEMEQVRRLMAAAGVEGNRSLFHSEREREREREREGETRDFIRSPCPETAGRSCLCLPTTCAVLLYSSFVGHPRLYLCLCNHTPALAPIFCHISPFHPPHPSLPCLFNAEQRSSCLSAQTCHELTKLIALREAMIADHGQVGPGRLTEEGAAVQSRGGGWTIEERMRCR